MICRACELLGFDCGGHYVGPVAEYDPSYDEAIFKEIEYQRNPAPFIPAWND